MSYKRFGGIGLPAGLMRTDEDSLTINPPAPKRIARKGRYEMVDEQKAEPDTRMLVLTEKGSVLCADGLDEDCNWFLVAGNPAQIGKKILAWMPIPDHTDDRWRLPEQKDGVR